MQDKPIPFRPENITAAIAEREIKRAVVAGHHAVGAVQAIGGLLRRPAKPSEKIPTFVGHAIAIGVTQEREKWRVHNKDSSVVIGQSLDRIEAICPEGG